MSFAIKHGPKMQVGTFTNSTTGSKFKACVFTPKDNPDDMKFVSFSSNLGELTPREIAAQKNELRVVELETEGYAEHHFSLCKQGENSWEDVDLGL